MRITSRIKKSISTASLLALSSTALVAGPIKTPDEALDRLTGQNQPSSGRQSSICVSVTPYFISSWSPNGGFSQFFSMQIDGATPASQPEGRCDMPDQNGKCERGFIKITSTAPIMCNVPIGL